MKKINKEYMSFAEGFFHGRPDHAGGMRQIDWSKLKEFIINNKDRISKVRAGLAEDWVYTSGLVYDSEIGFVPKEQTYVYAASRWATPAIDIEYNDGSSETVECWVYGEDADSYFENI